MCVECASSSFSMPISALSCCVSSVFCHVGFEINTFAEVAKGHAIPYSSTRVVLKVELVEFARAVLKRTTKRTDC